MSVPAAVRVSSGLLRGLDGARKQGVPQGRRARRRLLRRPAQMEGGDRLRHGMGMVRRLGRQRHQPQELAPGPSRQPLSGGHLGPVASQRPDRRHEGRHGVCPAGKRHQSGVHHHYRLGGSRRDRRRLPEQPPERGVFRLEARMGHSVGLAGRPRQRPTK